MSAPSKSTPAPQGIMKVTLIEGRSFLPMDKNGKSDPFVQIMYNNDARTKRSTKIHFETLNPSWNEVFEFHCDDPQTDKVKMIAWDYDKYSPNDFLGQATISTLGAYKQTLDDWFPLLDKGAKSKTKSKIERGSIHVKVEYIPPGKVNEEPSENRKLTKLELFQKHWEIPFDELHCEKELGRGAFGVVYRGKWRLQDVAIKILLDTNLTVTELQQFKDECGLMMGLRPHRNVIPLLGVCTTDSKHLSIVTDFIENGSLEDLIRSSALISWKLVLQICQGIVAGVYHLHKEKILHRDLAARNILLRANYEPLIADFGLSKRLSYQDLKELPQEKKNTLKTKEEGFFRGPYKWMSPESLAHNEFTVKSDSYSFGVVVYEIIARQEPYPNISIYAAASQVVKEGLRPPIPQNCPPKFENLMTQCWKSNPDERPDFAQLSALLKEIEEDMAKSS